MRKSRNLLFDLIMRWGQRFQTNGPLNRFLFLGLCLFLCASEASPPVEVFREWNGSWTGAFVGYDHTGKELYRIKVYQTYRTIDDTSQQVMIFDSFADGKTVTGKGRNIATRQADGTLHLRCIVQKSNGDIVNHRGRLVRGPLDETVIVWYSQKEGSTETFHESVQKDATGTYYTIAGMGIYQGTAIYMSGKYRKVRTPSPSSANK